MARAAALRKQKSRLSPDDRLQLNTLAVREAFRDHYLKTTDPIMDSRLRWRAQSARHLLHLLPGQTILELGCGEGFFTRKLFQISRGECPITALTFKSKAARPAHLPKEAEFLDAGDFHSLSDRKFDFVVGMDVLDDSNCAWLMQNVLEFLKPGGEVIFYESNPWNVVLQLKRIFAKITGRRDPRQLLSRPKLYELISEIGFIRVFAVYNDFVYWPLTQGMAWLLRNLSVILENTPFLRTFAGSILIHAQKPPRNVRKPDVSLFEHKTLKKAVSVVIPCYNEEMNIGPLISRLKHLYGGYLHEIIPVDDNSKDNTREILKKLAASDPLIKPVYRTPPNGVGRALADGFRAAKGKYVLSMDCDFQHLLPELRDMFDAAANGAEVVTGSRFSRESVLLNYPVPKIIANRGFHLLARLILWKQFLDLTNNLKLIRRDVLEHLKLTQPGFAINAETGLQPVLLECKITHVPISWIQRTPDMGTSSFRLIKVGGGYWKVLLNVLLKRFFGLGAYRDLGW